MKQQEIILTAEELKELRDTIKFREKVLVQLKIINGLPKTVWKMETHVNIQWVIISILLSGLVGIAWSAIAG